MKKYRNVVIACGALYFLAVLIFAVFTLCVREDPGREELVLKLNEIAHKVEADLTDTGSISRGTYRRRCVQPSEIHYFRTDRYGTGVPAFKHGDHYFSK